MLAAPVAGIVEQGCGRIAAGEGPVIANVDPQARGIRLARGQDRHSRIVAMQTPGGQDMGLDP